MNVTGEVYNDLNGNGNLDPGEPGLQGWTVNLSNQAGNTRRHDHQRRQRQLRVRQPVPRHLHRRGGLAERLDPDPAGQSELLPFATERRTNIAGLNFGNFKAITVTGNVYNDLDGNGLKGSGEPGLQGWTVELEDSSGNVLAAVLTDANGNYAFTGVGGGTYEVAEVVQTNWVQTQPLSHGLHLHARSGTDLLA